MNETMYIPALIMFLAFVVVLLTPLVTVVRKIISPIVMIGYVVAVGLTTAAARSAAMESQRVYQLAA